jgi:hypothetical protein
MHLGKYNGKGRNEWIMLYVIYHFLFCFPVFFYLALTNNNTMQAQVFSFFTIITIYGGFLYLLILPKE